MYFVVNVPCIVCTLHCLYLVLSAPCIVCTLHYLYLALYVHCIVCTLYCMYFALSVLCTVCSLYCLYLVLSAPCIVCTLHYLYFALYVRCIVCTPSSPSPCVLHIAQSLWSWPVGTHCSRYMVQCSVPYIDCTLLLNSITFSIHHSTQYMYEQTEYICRNCGKGCCHYITTNIWLDIVPDKCPLRQCSALCFLLTLSHSSKVIWGTRLKTAATAAHTISSILPQTNPKSTAGIAYEFVLEYGRFSMGGVVWHCCANKIWEMNALWLHLRSSKVAPANAPGRISVWQRTELPFRVLAPAF